MDCNEALGHLNPYLDGETGAASLADVERHLAGCIACRAEFGELRRVSQEVRANAARFKAPDGLARSISASLRPSAGIGSWHGTFTRRSMAMAASILFAAIIGGVLARGVLAPFVEDPSIQQVADAHRRSVLVDRVTEIASSDRQTLATWARDRQLKFAPPVADLKSEGFALLGGRRELIDGQPALALAYRYKGRIVDLFIAPSPTAATTHSKLRSRDDVNVVDWSESGLRFWAVSDIDGETLRGFHRSVERAAHFD